MQQALGSAFTPAVSATACPQLLKEGKWTFNSFLTAGLLEYLGRQPFRHQQPFRHSMMLLAVTTHAGTDLPHLEALAFASLCYSCHDLVLLVILHPFLCCHCRCE